MYFDPVLPGGHVYRLLNLAEQLVIRSIATGVDDINHKGYQQVAALKRLESQALWLASALGRTTAASKQTA